MKDLGIEENWGPMSMAEKKGKKTIHYPRESFTTDQMPGLEGAKVGQKVKMVFEAEVVEVSKGDAYSEKEGEDVKTRVTVKFRQGSSELMDDEVKDSRTEKQKEEEKLKSFSNTIGLDEDEEDM